MDIRQVTETIAMIEEQNFDIRTITIGISLLDCIDPDINRAAEKIYQKITTKAANLVAVGDEIAAELGIPIVNKRVSVTPISLIGAATDATDYVVLAKALDKAAKEIGVDFIGGFSALVQKGYQKGDEILINSIPRALAETDKVCSSVNSGSTKSGINMTAVADMDVLSRKQLIYQIWGQLSWLYSLMLLRTIHLWRVLSTVLEKLMLSSMSGFLVLVW